MANQYILHLVAVITEKLWLGHLYDMHAGLCRRNNLVVDGHGGALQAQVKGHTTGNHVQGITRGNEHDVFFPRTGCTGADVFVGTDTDEHADPMDDLAACDAGLCRGGPGRLHGQRHRSARSC